MNSKLPEFIAGAIKQEQIATKQNYENHCKLQCQKQKLQAELSTINAKIQKVHAHEYFIQATLDSYAKTLSQLQKKFNASDFKKIKKLLTEGKQDYDGIQFFQIFISIVKGKWFEGDVIV